MQTECPHCDTKFRVTESQLLAAEGIVRCGICNEIFNAIEIATDEKPHASLSENKTAASDKPDKDSFDFFNEENNQSLPHVVPDQFRDAYSPTTSSLTSSVLWSIGVIFLTATLIIQYAWFNHEQLSKTPQFQTAFVKLCQHINCDNISIRDPENIELITRNIFSHPTESDALMVEVTLKNNALFAQPYPVMQINFSDIRGNTIVARRFWPNEYLDSESPNLLPANSKTSISLEIQDPGKQAMTYEFTFL